MPRLAIDHREIDVPPGATILDAAVRLGIEIPTLCFSRQCEPSTSCLVCLVKVLPGGRLVPACATLAAEGMQVESETDEIHAIRRTTLELLLSDHLGDCVAPCSFGCPAQMNIPQMLRQIAAGQFREALITVKADIAMPAVLGEFAPPLARRSAAAETSTLQSRFASSNASWPTSISTRPNPICRPAALPRANGRQLSAADRPDWRRPIT